MFYEGEMIFGDSIIVDLRYKIDLSKCLTLVNYLFQFCMIEYLLFNYGYLKISAEWLL